VYLGLFVKYVLFFRCLLNSNFLERFSRNILNFKFHENPSCGNRISPWGRTDLMKLLFAFRNLRTQLKTTHLLPSMEIIADSSEIR